MDFPSQIWTFSWVAHRSEPSRPLFAASRMQQSQICAGVKLQKAGLGASTQRILGNICAIYGAIKNINS